MSHAVAARGPNVGKLQSRDAALRRSASLPPAPTARVFRRTGGAVQRLRSVWDEPGALSCAPRTIGRPSQGRSCSLGVTRRDAHATALRQTVRQVQRRERTEAERRVELPYL